MSGEIIVFAEEKDGVLKKSAFEVTTAAHQLASELGCSVTAVILSGTGVNEAASLGRFGATEIVLGSDSAFAQHSPEGFVHAIVELARERSARAVLLPASSMGKDLGPRISAHMGAPLISDCVGLTVKDGEITARRPVYAGKARWTVHSPHDCFLASLRPNVFTPSESGGGDVEPLALPDLELPQSRVTLKEVIKPEGKTTVELTEADIVVSGGRGMQGPENYNIIEDLASVLGGAVGASRAAVDAGWRSHSDQVGQTGKTVSPNLYIACGISGAIQHLAGMSSSRVIVAINKDVEAPIFKVANYGIVGDLFEVVPALTEEVRKAKA